MIILKRLQNNTIVELSEISVWAMDRFYQYYDLILQFEHCSDIEIFCAHLDASPEFRHIVFNIAKLWLGNQVNLGDLSVYDLHDLVFSWSFEVLEKTPAPHSDGKPVADYLKPQGKPYNITLARVWLGGMPLTDVIEVTKLLPQSDLNEVIVLYNEMQKSPDDRFKEWSKNQATEQIAKQGLGNWGEEIDL